MHTRVWLVKTQKSTTKCSFVKIVVLRLTNQERMRNLILSWAHLMIKDRNGPILNLDASERSASRIFVFHQGFLLFENVYFLILIYFSHKVGGPSPLAPTPARALKSGGGRGGWVGL